jgi:hypothetical protein
MGRLSGLDKEFGDKNEEEFEEFLGGKLDENGPKHLNDYEIH